MPVKSNTNANIWHGEPRHFSIKSPDWWKRETWLLCFTTPQDKLWPLRWEGKGSGNFTEGQSQLLASNKPVNLTRMKISKFGKMYSSLGTFNSMRTQHFSSTAIYHKVDTPSIRQQGKLCVRRRGPENLNFSTFFWKTVRSLTGSLNSVSNFLCC